MGHVLGYRNLRAKNKVKTRRKPVTRTFSKATAASLKGIQRQLDPGILRQVKSAPRMIGDYINSVQGEKDGVKYNARIHFLPGRKGKAIVATFYGDRRLPRTFYYDLKGRLIAVEIRGKTLVI